MTPIRIAIVGSGPSGIIAAKNFIDNGIAVDLYDVGITHSNSTVEGNNQNKTLLPKKTLFGSLFPYSRIDSLNIIQEKNISFDTSHAKGGLSNVWGATVGPPYSKDVADWPISFDELDGYVDRIFKIIGVTGSSDAIEFLYSSKYRGVELNYETPPTLDILNSAKEYQKKLIEREIYVGKSRLAIQADANEPNVCILCNKCMEGCSSNSIFSANHLMDKLLASPLFQYHQDCLVEKFLEDDDCVSLTILDVKTGITKSKRANYLVLGAGCLDTTRIINASKDSNEGRYIIKDSQKYYFPVLTFKSNKKNTGKSIELAHIYVQMIDYQGHIIQVQLYPGAKILIELFERLFGIKLSVILRGIFGAFIERFYIGMMYLHSDISGQIEMQFMKDKSVRLTGIENKDGNKVFNDGLWKMIVNARYLRFLPIPFFYLKAKLGHSQHFGSTLPMKVDNSITGVDINCRVNGFLRVFVVDSSALPSIPGTPTTTLIMANSLRVSDKMINTVIRI